MPGGVIHERINLGLLGGLTGAYAYARSVAFASAIDPSTLTVFCTSYLVGTFLVTPDLDLAEGNVRAKRHWGWLGLLWVPYGKLFRHRGLSHTWILGPLTRLLYLAGLGSILFWLAANLAPHLGYTLTLSLEPNMWQRFSTSAFLGYYASQWCHLLADGIQPDHALRYGFKKRRAKR